MCTPRIYKAVSRVLTQRWCPTSRPQRHLDIGAGRGELIQMLRASLPVESSACDFHVERFRVDGLQIEQVDLNREPLPYADQSFDLITCSEVIEHLENYRSVMREMRRVLRPGGLVVITTPNVLNAYSRLRYLVCGFANLFGPLPVKNDRLYSTGGHITPVPYFYLAHALLDADFDGLRVDIDKVQKRSVVVLLLLFPIIALGWLRFWRRETRRAKGLTDENRSHVRKHLSWPILVSRTVIVSALAV